MLDEIPPVDPDQELIPPDAPAPEPTPPVDTGPPPTPSLLERASSRGMTFDTEEALLDALDVSQRSLAANEPYVVAGKRFFAEQTKEPEPEPTPEPPAEPPKGFQWDVPEVDPRYAQICQVGDDGLHHAPADHPELISIATKLNDAQAARQEAAGRLLREFPQLVVEVVEDYLGRKVPESLSNAWQKDIQDTVPRINAQQQSQTTEQQYYQEHFKEFHLHDASGQPQVNQQTGEYLLSPAGEAFSSHYRRNAQRGVPEQNLFAAAREDYEASAASPSGQPPAPAQGGNHDAEQIAAEAAAKKQKFTDRAIETQRVTTRDGQIEAGTFDPSPGLPPEIEFAQRFDRAMAEAGLSHDRK